MGHQFHPLRFTAAQRRTGLAEFQVIQPGIAQRFQWPAYPRECAEEFDGFGDAEFEHLRDVFPAQFDVERFAAEPLSVAGFAADERRGQKIHFQFDGARAFTFGTTPLRAVEGESPGRVAAQTRFRQLREQVANFVEEPHVGRRRRARRASDRRLVHFVNRFNAFGAGDGWRR